MYQHGFVLSIWPSNCSQISPTPICHHAFQSQWWRFEYEFHQVQCSPNHLLSLTGFDQLWLNFERAFHYIQPFDCDSNLLELTIHYTLWNQKLDFKSKDGVWWTYVVCLYGFVSSIWPSNFSQIHQHQYVTILFNPNDQDLNMNFTKSSGLRTIY